VETCVSEGIYKEICDQDSSVMSDDKSPVKNEYMIAGRNKSECSLQNGEDEEDDSENLGIVTVNEPDSFLPPKSVEKMNDGNANLAALKNAHQTASQLTNWAGRVFQQAIENHIGDKVHVAFKTHDEFDSSNSVSSQELLFQEKQMAQVNSSIQKLSEDNSSNLDENHITYFCDTSLEGLQKQDNILRDEDNKRKRDVDTVTEEMVEDVMYLLQMFGIPYLKAPAEAEAQAVELEKLGLVDGVVTEDSDAVVFGSRSVYRNIFEDKKYVELYLSSDAEVIGLGYNEKIALAMLLGGDYTEGVKGVGIVNGMEILQAFPVSEGILEGLQAFRTWLDGFDVDDSTITDNSKVLEFTKKHKSARSCWIVPNNFPSRKVLQAYSRPVVNSSRTVFSWGFPDLDAICKFLCQKIGWEVSQIDQILLPVIKSMEETKRQRKIDGYFMRSEDNIKFANVRSKRLRKVWELENGIDQDNQK
jgi:DNA excision repair protein ERCC-5